MNDLPQPTPQPVKQTFRTISAPYRTDEHILTEIDKKASVHVMLKMISGIAVRRTDAMQVLIAFSAYTGGTWSLDNVTVALLPTFSDLHIVHNFKLDELAKDAGVSFAVLDMMLVGDPVSPQDARLVLQMVSHLASSDYNLETVDIPVTEGGNTNATE